MINRRGFLKMLGIGTGVAVAAPALLLEEPRRRIWQVGIDLAYPGTLFGVDAKAYPQWRLPELNAELAKMLADAEVARTRALLYGSAETRVDSDMADAFAYAVGGGQQRGGKTLALLGRCDEAHIVDELSFRARTSRTFAGRMRLAEEMLERGYISREDATKILTTGAAAEARDPLYVQSIDHERRTITFGSERPNVVDRREPFVGGMWSAVGIRAQLDEITGDIVRTLDAFGRPVMVKGGAT